MGRSVALITNRVGFYDGISGGGSAMREKLLASLKEEGHHVICLSAGKNDMKVTDSVRGPYLRSSFHNLNVVRKVLSRSDLLIVSGSYTPLWAFGVVLCRFFYKIPTVFICTMNADKAVATWENGTWSQSIAWHLFTLNDFVTSSLCEHTYTRSVEHARKLRSDFGMDIDGIMVQPDQYKCFSRPSSRHHFEQREEARSWLMNGNTHDGKNLLLFAGRLIPEKRIHLLVQSKPDNCVLAIVGAVTSETEREFVMKLHNPKAGVYVHVGFVRQPRLCQLYWAADAHVSASDYETLGNTVHESLLCGTPVVVENAGGYISQVSCAKNQGCLVDFTDKDAVHAALEQVFSIHGCTATDKNHTFSFRCKPLPRGEVVDGKEIVRSIFQASNTVKKETITVNGVVSFMKDKIALVRILVLIMYLLVLNFLYSQLACDRKEKEYIKKSASETIQKIT